MDLLELNNVLKISLPLSADVDECSEGTFICDPNALCINTIGSYTCTCRFGYSGDGSTCTGRSNIDRSYNHNHRPYMINCFPGESQSVAGCVWGYCVNE